MKWNCSSMESHQGVRQKRNDHEYHVAWRVTFEPGEARVVARKNGKVVGEQARRQQVPLITFV